MNNLDFIENQPRWRVALVARLAQLMGVLIHVEGIPFGSYRTCKSTAQTGMGAQACANPYAGTESTAKKHYVEG